MYRFWHCIDDLSLHSDGEALLWASIASRSTVTPKCRWATIHLVDFSAKVILHVYDDRGMDVVSVIPDAIVPLYTRYGNWLL